MDEAGRMRMLERTQQLSDQQRRRARAAAAS